VTFLEKTADPRRLRHVEGDMEADYIYTAGIAGDRFLRSMKKDRTLRSARCERCGIDFLPPRMYCERCLTPVTKEGRVPRTGLVEAWSAARFDEDGHPLAEPQVWAIVRFEGLEGGLVHRLLVPVAEAKAGMKVRPVFKEPAKRTAEITDLLGFVPA